MRFPRKRARFMSRSIATQGADLLLYIGLLIVFSTFSRATTVIVILGEDGISIATDSKIALRVREQNVGERYAAKCLIVQDRIAIADIGLENYRLANDGVVLFDYEFGAWVRKIESSLPSNVSFDDFVRIVKIELRQTIPSWQLALNSGQLQHKNSDDIFESPLQFVITGYQGEIPRVSVVKLYVDWDTKLVLGPYEISKHNPRDPIAGHMPTYFFGMTEAATNFYYPKSYAYKHAMACCTKTFQNFISGRSVPLNERTAIASMLVQIEQQTNPNAVGGEVRIIEITSAHGAHDVIHRPSKPTTRKQQQATKQ
jgi:hypothetical protein